MRSGTLRAIIGLLAVCAFASPQAPAQAAGDHQEASRPALAATKCCASRASRRWTNEEEIADLVAFLLTLRGV